MGNATKRPKTLVRKAKHKMQTQGKSEAITSFSSPGLAASAGGTAGSAASGLSAGSGRGGKTGSATTVKSGTVKSGTLIQAGNGRLVAVTAMKSAQGVFPRQSRQTVRFRTAQPDFILERPQRIILDAH